MRAVRTQYSRISSYPRRQAGTPTLATPDRVAKRARRFATRSGVARVGVPACRRGYDDIREYCVRTARIHDEESRMVRAGARVRVDDGGAGRVRPLGILPVAEGPEPVE